MGRREITFPVGGRDSSLAVQQQAPYTTPSDLNMRSFDVIAGRGRGGTRPGLDRTHYQTLGSGNPIRLLAAVNTIAGDNFDVFKDSFEGTSLGANWSVGQFSAVPVNLTVKSQPYASNTGTTEKGAVAAAASVTDFSATTYRIAVFIVPYEGVHAGTYKLHARMDATTPVSTTDGVIGELTLASGGVYSGTLKRYVAGVLTSHAFTGGTLAGDMPGWFVLEVTTTTTVNCYWRGNLLKSQVVAAATGNRFGFSMVGAAAASVCLVDRFRCQYYRTTKFELSRSRLFASSNGSMYRETWLEEMEIVPTSLTLASTHRTGVAEMNNRLVIADYSDSPLAYGNNGTASTTTFDSATYSDWTALGISKYDHAVQMSAGYASGVAVDVANYQITTIASGSLTLAASVGASVDRITFRVVRQPKVFNPDSTILATDTDGTTDGSGLVLTSAKIDTVKVIAKDHSVRVVSGTGATAGVYLIMSTTGTTVTTEVSMGTSATGVTYEIIPTPLRPLIATAGATPLGCRIVARHAGRLFFAGDPTAPQAWYASRINDFYDWDYGVSDDDSAAIAGAAAESSAVGEPLVDLCPWHRDKMMFACRSSLWLMVGDPRSGLQQVSSTIGLAAQGAWCVGPQDEMFFLSRDGIYATRTDCLACEPKSLSREKLPVELMDVGSLDADICMEYDVRDQGVHIYLTYRNSRDGASHWFFDMATQGFWQVEIPKTMEPTAICYLSSCDAEDDAVILAGRDGILRRHRDCAETDDGTAITSYAYYGPFRSGDEPGTDGKFMSYQLNVPAESGSVVVTVHPGKSALEALAAESKCSMTFQTGTSSIRWPKVKAPIAYFKHASSGRPIALEQSVLETSPLNAIK